MTLAELTRIYAATDIFRERLAPKRTTILTAIGAVTKNRPEIVETGCAYNPGDWSGAGLSTIVFAAHAEASGGRLTSVDIDPEHIAAAASMVNSPIMLVCDDSVRYLAERSEPIDLLYLDSLDYPYGELLDLYGGKEDLPEAIRTLGRLGHQVEERHYDIIGPSQEHCAREITAALPLLGPGSVVLIDDAGLPGGGKARLAKRVLHDAGWTNRLDGYQSLWVR